MFVLFLFFAGLDFVFFKRDKIVIPARVKLKIKS